jgi:hypothetical protein
MKSEIPSDQAAACGRAPHASLRTALMVTTRHLSQRQCPDNRRLRTRALTISR